MAPPFLPAEAAALHPLDAVVGPHHARIDGRVEFTAPADR